MANSITRADAQHGVCNYCNYYEFKGFSENNYAYFEGHGGRRRWRWEENIKMDLKVIRCDDGCG
jgi:hypothetical protein